MVKIRTIYQFDVILAANLDVRYEIQRLARARSV